MITDSDGEVQLPTRQRLLHEAVRLFAERGFEGTSVGDIEAAAGLAPRRGALYKHFASKLAVLEEALREHVESVRDAAVVLDELPLADVRAEAMAMGRWLLDELDRERAVTQVIEHDGHRLPDLRDAARERMSDSGYRSAGALVRRWLDGRAAQVDAASVAVCLVGAVVNFRRSSWTFGGPPLSLDDDRFLEGWADLCTAFARGVAPD